MNNGTLLVDLHASLLRLCTILSSDLVGLNFPTPIQPIYFDAHTDDTTLPAGDLVGFGGLEFEIDSTFVEGTFQIGMVTESDTNLFRLTRGMNAILSACIPGYYFDIVDSITGVPKGRMSIVDGVRLFPVSGKAAKPAQLISVSFVTTLDYQLL